MISTAVRPVLVGNTTGVPIDIVFIGTGGGASKAGVWGYAVCHISSRDCYELLEMVDSGNDQKTISK